MAAERLQARERLIAAGIELFRTDGFVATPVDDICAAAGVTKGAFFHHFASKEKLAEACLVRWGEMMVASVQAAPFQQLSDPVERLAGALDFLAESFASEQGRSCLAGTTVQEISHSHPALREAVQRFFTAARERFAGLLGSAARHRGVTIDVEALAALWMATIQGSLILYKASGDAEGIRTSLQHYKTYVLLLLNMQRSHT